MEKESLAKIEELAALLLTPEQICSILNLDEEKLSSFQNKWSEIGKLYRRVLAEQARKIHEQTLRLADVGSPSALDAAVSFLRKAINSIE